MHLIWKLNQIARKDAPHPVYLFSPPPTRSLLTRYDHPIQSDLVTSFACLISVMAQRKLIEKCSFHRKKINFLCIGPELNLSMLNFTSLYTVPYLLKYVGNVCKDHGSWTELGVISLRISISQTVNRRQCSELLDENRAETQISMTTLAKKISSVFTQWLPHKLERIALRFCPRRCWVRYADDTLIIIN